MGVAQFQQDSPQITSTVTMTSADQNGSRETPTKLPKTLEEHKTNSTVSSAGRQLMRTPQTSSFTIIHCQKDKREAVSRHQKDKRKKESSTRMTAKDSNIIIEEMATADQERKQEYNSLPTAWSPKITKRPTKRMHKLSTYHNFLPNACFKDPQQYSPVFSSEVDNFGKGRL